jgi:SAM-dependent methyltransferase
MSENLNPQAEQMADESMVRNLAAQAECIWPQERAILLSRGLPDDIRILDAGCGTGEISWRLAELFPKSTVLGVDIIEPHLELARRLHPQFGERLRFENRSIFDLGLPDATFDLVTCRHVIQAVPRAETVLAELARVLKPGGRLHVIAEDYGMIRFQKRAMNADAFWDLGPHEFGRATGTDLHVGRRAYSIFRAIGMEDVTVDYVVVDTLRCPRETFARIWEAWRDGYSDAIGEHTSVSADQARAYFDDMIATIRDEDAYGVWFVPVVSGVKPG